MSDKAAIAHIRKEYTLHALSEEQLQSDPIKQFDKWWQEAIRAQIEELNAMSLSTLDTDTGLPDARIVLLKEYGEGGFCFFTNYESKKAKDLAKAPQACLLFFWKELERQVRIQGFVAKMPPEASEGYFKSRPLGSKVAAWASAQSSVLTSRAVLEEGYASYEKKFGTEVPKPPHWGGYCLVPSRVEFWQGRASRLHDRLVYDKNEKGTWLIQRLAP